MEIFRGSFVSVFGASESANKGPSSADTIERLVERLRCANLLEDRRDTCRALKAMSRKFRTEVGVQALDDMVEILDKDRTDEEALSYALDTLSNICSPEEFEEEIVDSRPVQDMSRPSYQRKTSSDKQYGCIGEQFTEIFLKKFSNVQLVLDTLQEYDFKVRRPAIKFLTNLLVNKPRLMQQIVLQSEMGVSRLMDVLVDAREVLRNDALLLLIQLTKGHANLQKIVAFENAFDKLCDIMETEGYSDGGIVVEDCLKLMLNLLRNNSSNQTFFREGSYIQRISPFFDLALDEEELEVGWAAQKVSNFLFMLSVVRTLVSPSNTTQVATSCQNTIQQCRLFDKFCHILMAVGIPADILTETIVTIGECIRGNEKNQDNFAKVQAPSNPPRPVLVLLLLSMVNEKQPFELRCAILYCLQSYLHKNPTRQKEVMRTLLPQQESVASDGGHQENGNSGDTDEVTTGQLLCGGLFSHDSLSAWLSAVALSHGMTDQDDLKAELLKVQVSTAGDSRGPVSLLEQILDILQQSNNVQTRIGLLMLASNWVCRCTPAVNQVLETNGVIPFLTGQIGSNEHDDMERLSQGLCAFLLGLLIIGNDNTVKNFSPDELMNLVEKRIGCEIFLDKLSEVSKHEAYNRALKHPQLPRCQRPNELVLDHSFCKHFKQQEHLVINHLTTNQQNLTSDSDPMDPGMLSQYKELIREQDTRIVHISQANIYLQQELANSKQQAGDMAINVQTLQDQNSILKAQNNNSAVSVPHNGMPKSVPDPAHDQELRQAKYFIEKLEKELRVRDDIIHELEVRLTLPSNSDDLLNCSSEDTIDYTIEIKNLQTQLEALQKALAHKDNEIDALNIALENRAQAPITNGSDAQVQENAEGKAELAKVKEAFSTLQSEQEDLLMMLSEHDVKLRGYKKIIKGLGQSISDDDDLDLELSD